MTYKIGIMSFFLVLFLIMVTNVAHQAHIVDVPAQQEEQTTPPKIKTQPKMASRQVSQEHIECMATGIYYEAASEPFIGQVAVARVIMNRVSHGFGSNACKVVYQYTVTKNKYDEEVYRCQFSWACSDKPIPSEKNPRYRNALEIAKQVLLEDKWSDIIPDNTLFFHNLSVAPKWVYHKVATIGNHVFYAKEKKIPTKEEQDNYVY